MILDLIILIGVVIYLVCGAVECIKFEMKNE